MKAASRNPGAREARRPGLRALLERQRWLAGLALLLSLPLPLTGVVTWPLAGLFAAVAAGVALSRRPLAPVPNWVENLLAPLVVGVVVMAGGLRFGILRPVVHLAVLVAAVRLPGSAQPARTASFTALLALVGVAGIASSTHVSLVVYLLVVLAVVVLAMARLELLGLAGRLGGGRPADWPPARLVVASVFIAALVATPLFALLPRLRSPFAAGVMTGGAVSGFRETVSLNNIRSVQVSRARALRVVLEEGPEPAGEWLRLAGATSQSYRGGLWAQGQRGRERLLPGTEGELALGDEPAAPRRLAVTVEKPSDRIFLPPGATHVFLPERIPFWRDPQGSVGAFRRLDAPFSYALVFDPLRVVLPPPNAGDLEVPEELVELRAYAAEVTAGATNSTGAANLLEEHLRTTFGYTLEWPLDAPFSRDPVAWFLFEGKRGHCEFFASAMVLLLRSLEIPARLQTGYLGGEPDGAGGWVVRDANAHAWVVAYVDEGWRVFDPTPAVGRPAFASALRLPQWRLTWLRVEEFWDRWVLTFSLVDQLELARRLWESAAASWRRLALWVGSAVAGVVLLMLGSLAWRRRAPAATGGGAGRHVTAQAVARLRWEALRRAWVREGVTPRELQRVVAQRCPQAQAHVEWLVVNHEAVRYRGLSPPGKAEVRRQLRATLRWLPPAPTRW